MPGLLLDPVTGQAVPEQSNVDPLLVQSIFRNGTEGLQPVTALPWNSSQKALNDQAAMASVAEPPKRSLDEQRDSMLSQLVRGGLSNTGQYYTPKADLRANLAHIADLQRADAANTLAPQKLGVTAKLQYRQQYPDATDEQRRSFDAETDKITAPKGAASATTASAAPSNPLASAFIKAKEEVVRDPQGDTVKEPNPSGKGERLRTTSKSPGELLIQMGGNNPAEFIDKNFEKLVPMLLDERTGYGGKHMDQWFQQKDLTPPWRDPSPDTLARNYLIQAAQRRGIKVGRERRPFGLFGINVGGS